MKKVAVVILNWNGRKLLEQFLPVLLKNTPVELADCIIADNASTDDSLDFLKSDYPQLSVIALEKNYGFAEGYNRALAGLEYPYVVLLNSDVEVTAGWLGNMLAYLDQNEQVVAAQPKILSYREKEYFEYAGASGGFLDKYAYPFCRGRIFNTIEKDIHQYDTVTPVLWASGACMLIRLQSYKDAGGLDAGFFAHQEEIDLCWRLNLYGKKIVCIPESVVYHVGGATLAVENPQKTFFNFRNNLLLIYKNVPERRLKKVLFVRYFLDYLAAWMFFMKGHRADAYAIVRARNAFAKLKPSYKPVRESIQSAALEKEPDQIYQGSVLWNYHMKRKKTYSRLFMLKE